MANVFISHRGADTASAEKLATELRDKGRHQVWLDAWNINVGDSIVKRINEGLAGEIALILCLSSIGSSDWMDAEWMSALARQLNGEKVKLLPARLSGGVLPPILADRKYANLVADWDRGVTSLLKALG
jgi:TIR domain-containing protein